MTAEQFTYWLQGFLELSGQGIALTPAQVQMVREHLATVFNKVTPPLQPFPYVAPINPWLQPAAVPDWTYTPSTTCSAGGNVALLHGTETSFC